jgi:hypothetical protein
LRNDADPVVAFVQLLGISKIETSPSLLESTTIVFAYGLDLFSSRTMPSGTFDILSDSFNKAQLLLTMAALTVGILVTKVRPAFPCSGLLDRNR